MKASSRNGDAGRMSPEEKRHRWRKSLPSMDDLRKETLKVILKEMVAQDMNQGDLAFESELGLRTIVRYMSPDLKRPDWQTLESLSRGVGSTLCIMQYRAHCRLLGKRKAKSGP